MKLIPTEIDIRSPRILIEFDLHNNAYVECIDIGYILRLFYRVFRKDAKKKAEKFASIFRISLCTYVNKPLPRTINK